MNKVLTSLIIIISIISFFALKQKDAEIEKLTQENFTLNESLKSSIKIDNNKVKILYRNKEKIVYKNIYIPPENQNTTITTDKDDKINIIYKKYGTTFMPFIGITYNNKFKSEIGARLFYFNRFGTNISLKEKAASFGLDYRINYGIINNSAIGIFIDSDKKYGLSFHTFL